MINVKKVIVMKKTVKEDTQRNAKNTLTTNVDSTKNVPIDIPKL